MARHYCLVLMALAVLLGRDVVGDRVRLDVHGLLRPRAWPLSLPGRDVSAIVPTGAAILAATLVAGAIYRRGSVRSWLGIGGIGVFVVFFLFAGGFGFTGWKEPTQAPGSLQAEPGR